MTEKTITVELTVGEAKALAQVSPEPSRHPSEIRGRHQRHVIARATGQSKLRAALATSSQQEQPRCSTCVKAGHRRPIYARSKCPECNATGRTYQAIHTPGVSEMIDCPFCCPDCTQPPVDEEKPKCERCGDEGLVDINNRGSIETHSCPNGCPQEAERELAEMEEPDCSTSEQVGEGWPGEFFVTAIRTRGDGEVTGYNAHEDAEAAEELRRNGHGPTRRYVPVEGLLKTFAVCLLKPGKFVERESVPDLPEGQDEPDEDTPYYPEALLSWQMRAVRVALGVEPAPEQKDGEGQ